MQEHQVKPYKVVKTNLNAQVYDVLKEMIADRRFAPGSYINVEKLSQELGVSRTPIWEAIRRLEQEGIVLHTPHKGVRVRELTRKMALELYEVRENMESMAARLAAERASEEVLAEMEHCLEEQETIVQEGDAVAYSSADHRFHLLIYDASGNELLKDILSSLRYKALPLAFKLSPLFGEFLGYHRQILDAFRAKDSRAAEDAIRQHNRRMIDLIRTTPWAMEE